jgi:hypothetical protein
MFIAVFTRERKCIIIRKYLMHEMLLITRIL